MYGNIPTIPLHLLFKDAEIQKRFQKMGKTIFISAIQKLTTTFPT